jgi:hypothetical protein
MKTKLLITCFAFLFTFSLTAQEEQTLWGSPEYGFTGFWGGIDYNYTFLEDDEAYARGLTLAAEFGRDFLIGYTRQEFRGSLPQTSADRDIDLWYQGVYVGYAPNSYKAIHPKFNVALGGGRLSVDNLGRDRVFVVQPGAGIELNVFEWFRVGGEAGFRMVLQNDLEGFANDDFFNPYLQVGLRFGFSRNN